MPRWERKEIVLRTTATGHALTAPVFWCHGRNERPLAYIQANVHGGELQGNAAILALFDLLEKEGPRGSVILVPRANPVSANQQAGDYVAGVYDLATGQNFNRGYVNLTGPSRGRSACYVDVDAFAAVHRDATLAEIRDGFREALRAALVAVREGSGAWGLENRLEHALAIQEFALEADVVLDLHTGDRAPRYLYAPEGATAATRAFGIPFVLEVPPRFAGALDEASFVPWQDLADAFRRLDRTDVRRFVDGFTVELGSMNAFSMAQGAEDARRIASALRYYGVLDGEPDEPAYRIVCCSVERLPLDLRAGRRARGPGSLAGNAGPQGRPPRPHGRPLALLRDAAALRGRDRRGARAGGRRRHPLPRLRLHPEGRAAALDDDERPAAVGRRRRREDFLEGNGSERLSSNRRAATPASAPLTPLGKSSLHPPVFISSSRGFGGSRRTPSGRRSAARPRAGGPRRRPSRASSRPARGARRAPCPRRPAPPARRGPRGPWARGPPARASPPPPRARAGPAARRRRRSRAVPRRGRRRARSAPATSAGSARNARTAAVSAVSASASTTRSAALRSGAARADDRMSGPGR